ncbi:MAG: ferredoxin family protein [Candidatus Methylomirabilales bacterium]
MDKKTVETCHVHTTDKVTIKVLEEWCKGCDICVEVCKKHCLAMDFRGKVKVVNLETCNRCLLCDLLCPDFAISVE